MLSIFDIPTTKEQLSSVNQGIADLRYDEVQSLRNVTDTNSNARFGGSEIIYRWDYSSGKWWIPSRSYFRMKVKLSRADGTPLTNADQIAPNMAMADSMIAQVQFKIADKVCEDVSNNYAQIAALKHRLNRTGTWLNTTGQNLNMWSSDFKTRQQHITSDGVISDNVFNTDGPQIKTRVELGVLPACTVVVANDIVTFAGGNGLESNLFRNGDIIVINSGENRNFAFIVADVPTNQILTCIGLGLTLDNALVVGPHIFERWRYSELTNFTRLVLGNNTSMDNQGSVTWAQAADNTQSILNTQIGSFFGVTEGNRRKGGFITERTAAVAMKVSRFDLPIAVGNNQATLYSPTWDNQQFTPREDLGYTSGSHYTGMAIPILNAKSILRFQTINAGTNPLPNVRDIWKKGDFILYNSAEAGHNSKQHGLVYEVDPLNDGQSLYVIGSNLPTISSGAILPPGDANLNPLQGDIIGRVRFGSSEPPLQLANKARKVQEFELIWVPSLSIFDLSHAIPGGAKFEIVLVPFTNTIYQSNGIESKVPKVHGVNGDYSLQIADLRLYNCVTEGPLVETKQYLLDLQETRCTILPLTTSSKIQYSLDVSPSLNAVSIAFQDSAASTSSVYSNTRFKIRNDLEMQLQEFYIRISQLQRPQPDYELSMDTAKGVELLTELYARNIMYNGGYYDSSQETLKEFFDRGLFMHFPITRTATDRSTRCNISTRFSSSSLFSDNGDITPNALIFDHYKKVAIIQMDNGRITSIRISNS
jgi:hypothetical protein